MNARVENTRYQWGFKGIQRAREEKLTTFSRTNLPVHPGKLPQRMLLISDANGFNTFQKSEPAFYVLHGVSWGGVLYGNEIQWVTTTRAHLAKLMARNGPRRGPLQKVPCTSKISVFSTFTK